MGMLKFDLVPARAAQRTDEEHRPMHPDLPHLMTLQTHDLEARRLRDEIAALPKLVASLEAKLTAVTGQRAVVLDLIAKEEALRRRQESDIKDHQVKIARVRKQLDLAVNTVQVAAFEHEIAFAQGEITRLEDAELESMERSEALEAQRTLADAAVGTAEKVLAQERTRTAATVAADHTALAGVDAQRFALRPLIGDAALATYDRIAKGKGTAVAEALNQKCMACQMMLRPQRWNDLRDRTNTDEMMSCETCGRLLFYDPARDAPQRKTVPVESIAASIIRSL